MRSVVASGQDDFGQIGNLATCPRFQKKSQLVGDLIFVSFFLGGQIGKWGRFFLFFFFFLGWFFVFEKASYLGEICGHEWYEACSF